MSINEAVVIHPKMVQPRLQHFATQSSQTTSRMMNKLSLLWEAKTSSRSMKFFIDLEDVLEKR